MRALPIVFVLSGAAGLVYEVAWARAFAAVLGSAATAQALVLATFLGGLAAGYAWLGARADREAAPLALYGRLELGIGAWGLLSLVGLALLGAVADAIGQVGGMPWAAFMALRVAAAAALMLPGCILMGGTLPALGRHLVLAGAAVRPAIARLYFLNSLGAAGGALVAGAILVPGIGLPGAIAAAAAANLAIAWLVRTGRLGPEGSQAAVPAEDQAPPPVAPAALRLVPWIAAAAGFAALVLEAGWVRMFGLLLGPSLPGFSLMLAAVVLGLALGAWAAERPFWAGRDPAQAAGAALVAAGFAVVATFPLIDRVPVVLLDVGGAIGPGPAGFYPIVALQLAIALALVLPPAVAMGLALPLAARAAVAGRAEVGKQVGAIFAANTAGTVAGALLAGPWLLPLLGLRGLMEAGAVLQAAAGAALLLAAGARGGPLRVPAVAALPLMLAVLYLLPGWDQRLMQGGAYRELGDRGEHDLRDPWLAQRAKRTIVFTRDDPHGTVAVEVGGADRMLRVDGKIDASSAYDVPTQVLIGHLGPLRAPDAQDVLLVGYGSGITAGSLLTHPIKRLDLAEVAAGVLEAAPWFAGVAGHPLDDPRLALHQEDARGFMQRSGGRWDLIVSEPSNPWMGGVADLFTAEFYAACRAHLTERGQMVQWLQAYETDDETLRLILRTFRSVFPQVEVWQGLDTDLILIGSTEPMRPGPTRMAERLALPRVQADLARIGITKLTTLASAQLLAPLDAERLAGEGEIASTWRPRLEGFAIQAFYAGGWTEAASNVDRRLHANTMGAEPMLLEIVTRERQRGLDGLEFAEIVAYQGGVTANKEVADAFASAWLAQRPYDLGLVTLEVMRLRAAGRPAEALKEARRGLALAPTDVGLLRAAIDLELAALAGGKLPGPARAAALIRVATDAAALKRQRPAEGAAAEAALARLRGEGAGAR